MASHTDGIDRLPRWDPSNPTRYNYDSRSYDPQDYQAFKEARQKFGQQQLKAARARTKEVTKEVNKAIRDVTKGEVKKQAQKESPSRSQINAAAKAGKKIYASQPSECFASLYWQANKDGGGTVTGEFYHGGSLIYSGDMELDEFLDFASSVSLGKWYNENQPF